MCFRVSMKLAPSLSVLSKVFFALDKDDSGVLERSEFLSTNKVSELLQVMETPLVDSVWIHPPAGTEEAREATQRQRWV